MRGLALLALTVGWCWDRFTVLDPMRGIQPATKAERDLLAGRWS